MMRYVIALVLIIACVGIYRGWFHVTSDRAADKSAVTVTVDKDKVQQDKQKAEDKVKSLEPSAKN